MLARRKQSREPERRHVQHRCGHRSAPVFDGAASDAFPHDVELAARLDCVLVTTDRRLYDEPVAEVVTA
jgi:hypothetical protein